MAVSLIHNFVSNKSDPSDNTLVKPSNWNAQHTLTAGGQTILGVNSPSPGAVTDNACSALGFSLLAATTQGAAQTVLGVSGGGGGGGGGTSGFSTGDVKPTYKTSPDSGWTMLNDGTIGNGSSGATNLANASAQNLYVLLWTNCSNTDCPVAGGRGSSGLSDFSAGKTLQLPLMLGRVAMGAGAGSGITAFSLGDTGGENTHTLTTNEMPAHKHTINDPTHQHVIAFTAENTFAAGTNRIGGAQNNSNTNAAATGITLNNTGGGAAHNNMQPYTAMNFMICL
jgi:microcystin-dependent protein